MTGSAFSMKALMGALRGPLLLITLGVLLAADQTERIGFDRTWPALLILFGILKLAEHLSSSGRPSPAQTAGPAPGDDSL